MVLLFATFSKVQVRLWKGVCSNLSPHSETFWLDLSTLSPSCSAPYTRNGAFANNIFSADMPLLGTILFSLDSVTRGRARDICRELVWLQPQSCITMWLQLDLCDCFVLAVFGCTPTFGSHRTSCGTALPLVEVVCQGKTHFVMDLACVLGRRS